MTGIFKANNPINQTLLIVYALVLCLPAFFHGGPLINDYDGPIYQMLVVFGKTISGNSNWFFALATMFLITFQAIYFNRILNNFRFFPKTNFLPGMSFILLSGLFSEWHRFSSPLLFTTILIWLFSQLGNLYHNKASIGRVFQLGLITGLATMVYIGGLFFIPFVIIALLTFRPFELKELILLLIGFLTPFYFLYATLFLTDNLHLLHYPQLGVSLAKFINNKVILAAFIIAVPLCIAGGMLIQYNIRKQVVHVRKLWSVLLWLLITCFLVPFLNDNNDYSNWFMMLVPMSVFAAGAFYYINKKGVILLIHWLLFILTAIIGYGFYPLISNLIPL